MGKGLERNAAIGDIYLHDDGSLFRVIGYQPNPTVIVEKVAHGPDGPGSPIGVRESHAINCENAREFTKLEKK